MDKVSISPAEVAGTQDISIGTAPDRAAAGARPPIAWWLKAALAPLVLLLPIVCLGSFLLRFLLRSRPPQIRIAWLSYVSTLFAVSGILTTAGFVIALNVGPSPSVLSDGLSELDSRTTFPTISSSHEFTTEQFSASFKPLVTVVSPPQRNWFSRNEGPSPAFGAGIVLQANAEGYLIATARHVLDLSAPKTLDAMVASSSGTWAAAHVIARHQSLDLLLLWLPRTSGAGNFILPVTPWEQVKDGAAVYAIGHPQGLRFTLSNGIISRKDQDTIQFTAPISPGNSGGPLFNSSGELEGIVTSMVDRNRSPNAEGLSFAVRADALLSPSGWNFFGDGQRRLTAFDQAQSSTKKEN